MEQDLERIERRRGECDAELKRYRIRRIIIGFAVMVLYVGVAALFMVLIGRAKAAAGYGGQEVAKGKGAFYAVIVLVLGLVAGNVSIVLFTLARAARLAIRDNAEAVRHYADTVKWAVSQGREGEIPSVDETLDSLTDVKRLKKSLRPNR